MKETTVKLSEEANKIITEIKEETGINKGRLVNDLLIDAGNIILEGLKNEKNNESNQIWKVTCADPGRKKEKAIGGTQALRNYNQNLDKKRYYQMNQQNVRFIGKRSHTFAGLPATRIHLKNKGKYDPVVEDEKHSKQEGHKLYTGGNNDKD